MSQKRLGPNNRILLNLFKIFFLAWIKKNLPEILWLHPSLYPLFCNKAAWGKGRKTNKGAVRSDSAKLLWTDNPSSWALFFSLITPGGEAGSAEEEEKT